MAWRENNGGGGESGVIWRVSTHQRGSIMAACGGVSAALAIEKRK